MQSKSDIKVELSQNLESNPGNNTKLLKNLQSTKNSLLFLYTLQKLCPQMVKILEAVHILEKCSLSLLLLDILMAAWHILHEKPSDNIDIKSYYANYKYHDTKAKKLLTPSLAVTVPRVWAEGEYFEPLNLSEESEVMVWKIAQMTYTPEEIEQQLAIEKEAQRKELKKQEEKATWKRKREESKNLKFVTVQMVKNPAQLWGMTNKEIQKVTRSPM